MKQLLHRATSGDLSPRALERSIRTDDRPEMRYRRAIVGVSLVGMAAMGVVTLLQTGILKHLPDPKTKTPHFDTDKVNTSEEAFSYGMPDAPLTLIAHSAAIALAAAGPADRGERRPWLPVLASLLSLPQAAIAAKYLFHQMPKVDRAWCPWCVVDALTHFAAFALTLPEARKALRA
ncbi:MAG: vitamin K epoxide reductase family protein [Allosphingosinicella sp.]|uniref:vitamin K epoxide reductase family protein n=1 Tax=Allosphingosinicella sp. TaxID=2823234 RepID=UPI003928BC03